MAHIVLLKNNSASHKMGKVLNAFTCSYVTAEEEKFVTFFVLSLRVVALVITLNLKFVIVSVEMLF